MVIDDPSSEPVLMTAGTRRTKRLEGSYDRQNMELSRHESQSFENANVSSAQVLAGSHFRQKRPQRRYTAKCTSRAKDHILPRDDCNGDLGVFAAWWPTRSGPHVHGVFQFTLIIPKVVLFSFSLSETVCGSPRSLGQTIWGHASQNIWENGWSVHHSAPRMLSLFNVRHDLGGVD